MDLYQLFREDLHKALRHLHNPDYTASPALMEVITGDGAASTATLQYAIIQAIRQLAPPPDTPDSASTQRNYELLVHRFVENLTQAETAERLYTTQRNIRRMERVATHMLASSVWERRAHRVAEPEEGASAADTDTDLVESSSRRWRSQARRELDSLRQSDPAATADVDSVVSRVVELEQDLTKGYGVTLTVGEIAAALTAAVHPTALRQILIMAIGQFSRVNRPCEIRVDAWEENGYAVIRLRGTNCSSRATEEDALTIEMVHLLGGSLTTTTEEVTVDVICRVPAMGKVNVAVIDDNQDFIHFCRRCARGTRFHILKLEDWTVAAIREANPDVILLDIMLPGVDGWELLSALRHSPVTTDIPVVICSIVREEALASLMGAVEYLPKPIDHRDLLDTLERVTSESQ